MLDWFGNLWYDFCYSVTWTALEVGFSLRFEGGRNVPAAGPALLVANHVSFLDPPAVGVSTPRRLSFLARKTLFNSGPFGALLRSLRAFPIDQEGVAVDGIRAILALLAKGNAVLMFPEGERSRDGTLQPLKPGIALLIKYAKPPVIPVGVAGVHEALPRSTNWPRLSPIFRAPTGSNIAVAMGKPLDGRKLAAMPRAKLLNTLSEEIRQMMCRAERLRGA